MVWQGDIAIYPGPASFLVDITSYLGYFNNVGNQGNYGKGVMLGEKDDH